MPSELNFTKFKSTGEAGAALSGVATTVKRMAQAPQPDEKVCFGAGTFGTKILYCIKNMTQFFFISFAFYNISICLYLQTNMVASNSCSIGMVANKEQNQRIT